MRGWASLMLLSLCLCGERVWAFVGLASGGPDKRNDRSVICATLRSQFSFSLSAIDLLVHYELYILHRISSFSGLSYRILRVTLVYRSAHSQLISAWEKYRKTKITILSYFIWCQLQLIIRNTVLYIVRYLSFLLYINTIVLRYPFYVFITRALWNNFHRQN